MCAGDAKWKREVYPEHKFDFIDTRDFRDNGSLMHLKYFWLYLLVLKSFLVYISDIFSVTIMLTTSNWSNATYQQCQHLSGCFFIPFVVGKWLFVGCIILSFLLLAYESRKAKKIIASRDISYAFTNVTANNYFCLRSYDHFCFFDQISNSTKKKDDFAFFIFFTFKSWKRLLLADAPRQVINALTLYSIYLSHVDDGPWYKISKYFSSPNATLSTSALTVSTFFTVTIFAGSAILLFIAALCYIPLLCYIQGNLKEYICHKVDKRIDKFIRNRNRVRHARAAQIANAEANGDFSHLKNKKGESSVARLPQPTLPNLSVDDDDDDMTIRKPAASIYTNSDSNTYVGDNKSDYPVDYPPMPQLKYGYHTNPSVPSMHTEEDPYYENESTAHLALSAAPFSANDDRSGPARYTPSPAPYYSSTMAGSAPYTHEAPGGYSGQSQQHYGNHQDQEEEENPYGGHEDAYVGHEDVYNDLYASYGAQPEATVRQTGHARHPSQTSHPASVHRRHASRQESDPHLLTSAYIHPREDNYQYEMQPPVEQGHSWRGNGEDYGRRAGGGYAL